MDNKFYDKALEFAKNNNYETVEYLGKYENYFVYEPVSDVDLVSYTGLPNVILVNEEEVRLSTYDETMALMDYDFEK